MLLDQNRFGDHRTCAAGTRESGNRRNEMDESTARSRMREHRNRSRNPRNALKLAIRHRQDPQRGSSGTSPVEYLSLDAHAWILGPNSVPNSDRLQAFCRPREFGCFSQAAAKVLRAPAGQRSRVRPRSPGRQPGRPAARSSTGIRWCRGSGQSYRILLSRWLPHQKSPGSQSRGPHRCHCV